MRKSFSRCAAMMAFLAGVTVTGWAQTTTQGAISGTVFDATNAAIPGATIVIHNNANNAEIKLTSNGSGFYTAPQLPAGTYTVTVSAAGFSEVRSSNVTVEVNLATEVSPHLSTGETSTVVEVTSEAPVLNFESAEYGGHLTNQEIENIPVNNRRWSTLALLTPGVVVDTSGFGLLSFHAISPLLNNVEIDGADDNQAFFSEERGRTRAGYSTSQVAVREFQVNSAVYSAEFGRAVGGVVNSITKSGGNQIHGEAYFYNRNSSRSAYQPLTTNTTYNAATNTYITSPYKPKDNRNQYGFGVGGPIKKDKVFFFYAFDKYARNFPGTGRANNPATFFTTPTLNAPGNGGVCNTTTGAITTPAGGTPATAIDTAACLLSARQNFLVPGTTYANGAASYNNQLQLLLGDLGAVPRFGDQEINTPKIDFQINSKQHLSLLYHRLRWDSPGGVQTQSTNIYSVDGFGTDFVKLDYGVAILESQLGSRLVNELRYQYGRELNDEGRQTPSSYTNNFLTNSTGVPTNVAIFTTTGFTAGTPYYSFRTAYPDERKWQIGDTASIVLGKNTIKFGEDFVHNYDLQNNLYEGNGFYSYSSVVNYITDVTTKGASCNSTGTGIGATGTAYGCYSSFAQGFGQPIFALSTQDYGVFVQDDYKATPRLTLNLGVRYDYEKLPQAFAPNPLAPQTAVTPSDKNNVSPRIGFAWDPYGTGKTAVHGGFGIYYGRIINATLLNAYENTAASNSQAAYSFQPNQPGAPLLPNVATVQPPAALLGPSIQALGGHLQNPYSEQFDLAVQQELGAQTVFSVAYVGSLSRELPNFLNLNLNPAASYNFNYTVAPAAGTTVASGCGPIACGTVIPVKVYSNRTQVAPFTYNGAALTGTSAYAVNTLNTNFNAATSVVSNINANYHAVTAELQRRMNKYYAFDVNYTWSKSLDYNQNQSTSASTNNWFDPYAAARSNYGYSNLNIPHRVVGWALLNFPGTHGNEALKQVTNGWSIKPLVQAQSGLPYSATVSGTAPSQCNAVGCLEANSTGLSGTGVTYIPLLGRNGFKQPPVLTVDTRVQKEFAIREKYNLQIFAEVFNLPNHFNITGVNGGAYAITNTVGATPALTSSNLVYQTTFQSVTSANSNYAYNTRLIQIAGRFIF